MKQRGKSSDTVRAKALEEKFCFEALPENCQVKWYYMIYV